MIKFVSRTSSSQNNLSKPEFDNHLHNNNPRRPKDLNDFRKGRN